MATARRQFFLEFLKAFIADLITLLFSSLQNPEGSGDGDSSDSCADPCQFLPFPKTKILTLLTVTVLFLFTFFNFILDAPRT